MSTNPVDPVDENCDQTDGGENSSAKDSSTSSNMMSSNPVDESFDLEDGDEDSYTASDIRKVWMHVASGAVHISVDHKPQGVVWQTTVRGGDKEKMFEFPLWNGSMTTTLKAVGGKATGQIVMQSR